MYRALGKNKAPDMNIHGGSHLSKTDRPERTVEPGPALMVSIRVRSYGWLDSSKDRGVRG